MEDITVNFNDGVLNCRAAAIIEHDGKILFHKNKADDYYALIGGRVKINESSDNTIKREILEELGKEIELTGYIGTVENFFIHKDKKYHEIMFIHKAEFVNDEDKKITETMQNIEVEELERGAHIEYVWLDVKNLNNYNVRPKVVKEVLCKGNYPVHIVNSDL